MFALDICSNKSYPSFVKFVVRFKFVRLEVKVIQFEIQLSLGLLLVNKTGMKK